MVVLLRNHPTEIPVEWLRRLLCVATIAFSAPMSGKRSVEAFRLILRGQQYKLFCFPSSLMNFWASPLMRPIRPHLLVFLTVGVASNSS
jgi:hypothetical protein